MSRGDTAAASFLALGFGGVTAILLFVEPAMGFGAFADYFDPARVLAAAPSTAWLIGDLIYLGFGPALARLAVSSADRYLRATGLIAAVAFFFIGSLGRVMAALPAIIEPADQLQAAVLGLLPVRFAALRTTVFALGVFAWRTTRPTPGDPRRSPAWQGLGYLALAASIAFIFVFLPVPLLFAVWATWLAVRHARAARARPAGDH